jgi:hypothetical protein
MMTTGTTEAIVFPIDLEASLGKIEDIEMYGTDDMDCEPVTRTSNNPFRSSSEESLGKDHHIISPYPYSETDAEIRERQRLAESVETTWSMPVQAGPEKQPAWSGEDLELIPDDGDDDFSLSSQEAGSLSEEGLQLEKIADPASFWETCVPASTADQPTIIPFSVSFSSGCDSSQRSSGC